MAEQESLRQRATVGFGQLALFSCPVRSPPSTGCSPCAGKQNNQEILQSRCQPAAVLPGNCITTWAQTLACQFALGFFLSLLSCQDHFSLFPLLSSLGCSPSLILSCQIQGDPGQGSLAVRGGCHLLARCRWVSAPSPRVGICHLAFAAAAVPRVAVAGIRHARWLASGQQREAGDLP